MTVCQLYSYVKNVSIEWSKQFGGAHRIGMSGSHTTANCRTSRAATGLCYLINTIFPISIKIYV